MGVESGPVLAVLGDLEDPIPERRAAVAPAGSIVSLHQHPCVQEEVEEMSRSGSYLACLKV